MRPKKRRLCKPAKEGATHNGENPKVQILATHTFPLHRPRGGAVPAATVIDPGIAPKFKIFLFFLPFFKKRLGALPDGRCQLAST